MPTPREEQVERTLAEQEAERRIAALSDEDLSDALNAGWKELGELRNRQLPIFMEQVARQVRAECPDAVAVILEPTDQGGDGWVLRGVELRDGIVHDEDALHDSDTLSVLLYDYGFWHSSWDGPDPFRLELPQPGGNDA